jgi:hypothetical protein
MDFLSDPNYVLPQQIVCQVTNLGPGTVAAISVPYELQISELYDAGEHKGADTLNGTFQFAGVVPFRTVLSTKMLDTTFYPHCKVKFLRPEVKGVDGVVRKGALTEASLMEWEWANKRGWDWRKSQTPPSPPAIVG